MLNPQLDIESLAAEFARDGRIRIANVLQPEVAERVRECCLEKVPFDYVYNLQGANQVTTREQMAGMGKAAQREMHREVMEAASRGQGFLYCGYMLADGRARGEPGLEFLQEFFDFVNGDEMLDFVRAVTGKAEIIRADGQLTRYTAGQFLTRHRDDPEGEERRLAYVFGFSRDWHPDWGGLLQFYQDDGTPREAWAPAFNSLSMFDVRHVHSVTYVTPFASGPRLSLTGWFRAA